jgi:hypothetical protein
VSTPHITPTPTDEEAAAIVAALELAWPRPVMVGIAGADDAERSPWRFSGRWWARRDIAADRRRPR